MISQRYDKFPIKQKIKIIIRKDSPNPRLPLRGGLHLSKTSPGRIAVFETPMPVAVIHCIRTA